MNLPRKIMIFLTALVFGSLSAWLKTEWREADRHERKWIVGLAVLALFAAALAFLRAFGFLELPKE